MVGIAVVKAGWWRWEATAAPVDLVIGCATYEAVLWRRAKELPRVLCPDDEKRTLLGRFAMITYKMSLMKRLTGFMCQIQCAVQY